ncbi:MAG: leucine-rich repeat domain-containing protein [Bacteroides sp.]|nr:leucine-rich repeat domain-containing protein [Bacillota bacterium]MCM1393382.1 leucine-rich repeat domain-containing protein [[Eubacterium] siraeum]MCM1455530.1 leucine-rich repeat domain-containing protein [Bacteroides sp.]
MNKQKTNGQPKTQKNKKLIAIVTVLVAIILSLLIVYFVHTYAGNSDNLKFSLNEDGTYAVSGFSGDSTITKINIPSKYEGLPVTSISDEVFKGLSDLKKINIPDSVINIGYNAFDGTAWYNNQSDGLVYLNKIAYSYKGTMPEGTSITLDDGTKGIASRAFDNCIGLTSITIPNSVISMGYAPFADCHNLESIYISDMEKWCNISFERDANPLLGVRLYLNEELVEDLTIPDGITEIKGGVFARYTYLKSVSIPDSVTSIGYNAFSGCTSLININIPDSVTSIGGSAFSNCTALRTVTIGKGLTYIGSYVFNNCKLTTINYNATECAEVQDIDHPIFYVGAYAVVNIGDNVTLIPSSAFRNCTSITHITIPNSVTRIGGYAFYGCSNLSNIIIPDSVTYVGRSALSSTAWYNNQSDGLVYAGKVAYSYKGTMPKNTSITLKDDTKGITDYAFKGCSELTNVTIPNSVTNIGEYSFSECSKLTNVTIPDSIINIGEHSFSECSKLTNITIPVNVTAIGNSAFNNCTDLITVNWNATSCTTAGSKNNYIFSYCTKLSTVNIGSNVTSIPDYAFSGYNAIANINVDSNNTNFLSQDGVLYDKAKTTIICVPTKITGTITIPATVTNISGDLFASCASLKSIIVDESNSNYASQDGILYNKSKTSIIHVPKSISGDITIPNGVNTIEASAFNGRTGLASITIPKSVKNIGACAFGNYFGILNIHYNGTKKQWKSINKNEKWAKDLGYNSSSVIIVHCTNGNLDWKDNDYNFD